MIASPITVNMPEDDSSFIRSLIHEHLPIRVAPVAMVHGSTGSKLMRKMQSTTWRKHIKKQYS